MTITSFQMTTSAELCEPLQHVRRSMGVEPVTSATAEPTKGSNTITQVHRHRLRDAFRSRDLAQRVSPQSAGTV